MNNQQGPIRHVFAWQVADGHDRDRVVELLTEFSASIDVIRHFEIGSHQGDPGENGEPWDGVLITDFDTWQDLDSYSNHPTHVELVAELLPMVKARAVVDFVRGER